MTKMTLKKGYSLIYTDKLHRDKNGTILCKIQRLVGEKPTRYNGAKLRELRALRGIGNVRKIK